jgi:hypothetical protein
LIDEHYNNEALVIAAGKERVIVADDPFHVRGSVTVVDDDGAAAVVDVGTTLKRCQRDGLSQQENAFFLGNASEIINQLKLGLLAAENAIAEICKWNKC